MPPSSSPARGDLFSPECPTRRLLDRIGTKWTSMAVKVLAEAARSERPGRTPDGTPGGAPGGAPGETPGEIRFAELRRRMPGVSQKMLSATLRSMARDGLVARRVEPTVPPRVHYRLTPLGLSLEQPLALVRAWAEEHMADIDRANRRYDAEGEPAAPDAASD